MTSYSKKPRALQLPRMPLKLTAMRNRGRANVPVSAELEAVFCRGPLLKTEDPAAYKRLFDEMMAALKPRDAAEYVLVVDIVDYTWEIQRFKKLKAGIVNEAHKPEVDRNVDPMADAVKAWSQSHRPGEANVERKEKLPVEEKKTAELSLTWRETAAAFQDKISTYEHIDQLHCEVETRRNNLFAMLDYYRAQVAQELCDNQIIDGECMEQTAIARHGELSNEEAEVDRATTPTGPELQHRSM
jgi:hypothetical protein